MHSYTLLQARTWCTYCCFLCRVLFRCLMVLWLYSLWPQWWPQPWPMAPAARGTPSASLSLSASGESRESLTVRMDGWHQPEYCDIITIFTGQCWNQHMTILHNIIHIKNMIYYKKSLIKQWFIILYNKCNISLYYIIYYIIFLLYCIAFYCIALHYITLI